MKKILLLIACFSFLQIKAQDTLITVKQFRPTQMSLAFDWGWSAARHTYLAPLLYNGISYGLHFDRSREMKWNRWENYQLLDVDFASGAAEHGENSDMWTGRAMYRYAMHWGVVRGVSSFKFQVSGGSKFQGSSSMVQDGSRGSKLFKNTDILIGPYLGAETGFDYNLKLAAGNNPATVRAVINAGASMLVRHGFSLKGKVCQVDLLAQMPLLGIGLMPEFGSSYYEAFYLENNQQTLHFTSLHNQQDVDIRLGVNMPVSVIPCLKKCKTVIRLGGYYHIDTMDINDIVSRYSSVGFTVGWTWKYLPL